MNSSFRTGSFLFAAGVSGLVFGLPLSAQVTFTGLGSSTFLATDVSNDGSVVVGLGWTAGFRWTHATGAVALPTIAAPGYTSTSPMGVSSDGSTVGLTAYGSTSQAAKWTQGTGTVGLGTLPGSLSSTVDDISGDGSTVVGTVAFHPDATTYYYRAFRATAGGGMSSLGTIGGEHSEGRAASEDGSVIIGSSSLPNGSSRTFRWTEAGGMQELETLAGGDSIGVGMNSDGSIVVGLEYHSNGSSEAYRWTEAEGMVGLGQVRGSHNSVARGVSDDGSIIVGDKNGGDGGGFVWTPGSGMRDFLEVLTDDYGIKAQLAEWNLLSPFAISANGRYIVGFGTHGNTREGWLLDRGENPPPIAPPGPPVISTVPEPSSLGSLAGIALAALAGLKWRRGRG